MLSDYAFWAVAGYTVSAVIATAAAVGVTLVAVQLSRLVKGGK